MAAASVRKFFVGGNWKSTGTKESVRKLVAGLNGGASTFAAEEVEAVVAPAFVHLSGVVDTIDSARFSVAAQNVGDHAAGAFTGSANIDMLKDAGAKYVILGHSERRHVFGESNELIGKKAARVLAAGLGVIACVGETLDERKAGKTNDVVLWQLAEFAKNISDWSKVVIAYEPVWAIGTGAVASPQDAQAVHFEIRRWLSSNVSTTVAHSTRVIYGGSVKSANCRQLAEEADIDGFLVGGASLDPQEFLAIISNSKHPKAKI